MGKKNKQFWRFENSAENSSEGTLHIYGDIKFYDMGWWNWPDDVIPHQFKNDLAELGDVDTIHVRINSNGGSVFGAYAIMNLLRSHKAKIITYNDGIAASAATLIAMAGDRIVSSIGSVWMIHLPSTSVSGNAKDLQKAIEILDTITDTMADIYHAKTGIDRAEIMRMMNEDKWMTGKEALEMGFVDEVTGLKVEAYLSDNKATAFFNGLAVNLAKVKNKEAFVAMLQPGPQKSPAGNAAPQNTSNAQEPKNEKEEGIIMNLADLKAKHPEIYNAAVNEGVAQATSSEAIAQARAEGAAAERARIQDIDGMSMNVPGMRELAYKAKYETGITAPEFAMEFVKAQAQKGTDHFAAVQADAAAAGEVPPAGAPQNSEEEEAALLAHAEEVAKTIRK